MVWLKAKSINLAALMKAKTTSGVRFKFDWCASWLRDIDLSPPSCTSSLWFLPISLNAN